MTVCTVICAVSWSVCVVLGGVAGAGAKVTGTLGNVVAKLTFDKDHQESRIQDKGKQDSSILHRFGGLGKVFACTHAQVHDYTDTAASCR